MSAAVALTLTFFIAACIFFAVVICMAAAEGDRKVKEAVERQRPKFAAMVEASKDRR
jgi:cytochrome bd-type quinol oxidase subunit 1